MMEENAPYRFVMKSALALGLFLCAAGMSSCASVSDSSERLSFASCKLPGEEALRLKDEAEVTVFHTEDGDIAYLAWETVCRDASEVRERLAAFVPPHTEPITVSLELPVFRIHDAARHSASDGCRNFRLICDGCQQHGCSSLCLFTAWQVIL